jgi:hypothetical protein
MKKLLLPLAWFLVLAFSGPTARAAANAIPAHCADFAQQFLIRGAYGSSKVGAKFWNLGALAAIAGVSPSQANCLEVVWRQAQCDQREYWQSTALKYHCAAGPGQRGPESANASCPALRWNAVHANMAWLNISQAVWDQTHGAGAADGEYCRSGAVGGEFSQIQQMALDSSRIEAEAANSYLSVDLQHAATSRPSTRTEESSKCRGVPASDRKSEFGGPRETLATYPVMSCAADVLRSIQNNLINNFSTAWDIVKATAYGAGKLAKGTESLLSACFHEGVLVVAREYYNDSGEDFQKLEVAVISALEGMGDTVLQEWSDLQCYNHAARDRWACQVAGYLGPDVVLFLVPGAEELLLTKLQNIPAATRAIGSLRFFGSPVETGVAVAEGAVAVTRAARVLVKERHPGGVVAQAAQSGKFSGLKTLDHGTTISKVRHAVVGGVIRVADNSAKGVWGMTETLSTTCYQNKVCVCQVYLSEGINPETHEPIEISPFTCDHNGTVQLSRPEVPPS